ncbi:hypothetical protein GW765_01540 [Candidatus Parcubacteria bacterium]|nr:hypothetical protein [Candidatus Parcubacteria bacterium]
MKYLNSLEKLGLSENQAKIYESLVSARVLPVRLIATKSGIGRELTYIVLGQLEDLGLVEREEKGKIRLFRAKHPKNVRSLIEKKEKELKRASRAYEENITEMMSDYNMAHNKPHIEFYEGLEGVKKTYEDILKSAKEVRVIRSLYDRENKDIRSMVTEQLERQSMKGIRSFVLTPHLPHMGTKKLAHNLERNITRKIIPVERFTMPAQVMIYNNTVSITSMKDEIVTTIIESEDIAKTFENMFRYMWDGE